MKKLRHIGIDFDGTIADEGVYPEVGEMIPHAKRVINKLHERGFFITIWTCREDGPAENAKKFLLENGIHYDFFNENPTDLIQKYGNNCRKLGVDAFIDDKNIFCKKIDWLEIESFTEANWEAV